MSSIVALIIAALASSLAVAFAYVPLRILVGQIDRSVRQLIDRQRERRMIGRETPERRKAAPPMP